MTCAESIEKTKELDDLWTLGTCELISDDIFYDPDFYNEQQLDEIIEEQTARDKALNNFYILREAYIADGLKYAD